MYRIYIYFTFEIYFRYNTYVVDGHDVTALVKAFYDASTVKGKPTAIVAKTFKGKGFPSR